MNMKLEIIRWDITALNLDAIVNAANRGLMGGGGVDGAIHDAAGPKLDDECREIKRKYPNGFPIGEAVIAGGYNLPAKHVILTVGPMYHSHKNPEQLLANAYKSSLTVAEDNNLKSIAFPSISTGMYGYPKEEAAQVVKTVMEKYPFKSLQKVVLCFYSDGDKEIAEQVFNSK